MLLKRDLRMAVWRNVQYLYVQAQQVQHQNRTTWINMYGYSSVNKMSMSWRYSM